MKLSKAKEIVQLNIKEAGPKMPPDTLKALIMCSSALDRIGTMRSYNINQAILPLKGETKTNSQNLPEQTLKKLRESPIGQKPEV